MTAPVGGPQHESSRWPVQIDRRGGRGGGKGLVCGPVTSQIDYKALFMAAPNPNLVLG
ncbi:hypothetical protein GCM10010400_46990 [Streptomyces aculeolatus]